MSYTPLLYRFTYRGLYYLTRWMRTRYRQTTPPMLLVAWFSLLVLAGAVLLRLPISHHGGVDFIDALFTSTSAVCVTGLAVVDTGTEFTRFGQLVLLMLIQSGGLGIMTFAGVALHLLGRRLPLGSQAALEDSLFQRDAASEFNGMFLRVFRLIITAELLGAVLLFTVFVRTERPLVAAWSALFHSVSAFCNAGFSLYSANLEPFAGSPVVMSTIMVLVILGGLGPTVLAELYRYLRWFIWPASATDREYHRLSVQTKVVLSMSALLILGGAVSFVLFGLREGQGDSWFSGALFHSVVARTAGFNAVSMGSVPDASLMVFLLLMFVGGSPGSCAGGVKTTTFAIWLGRIWSGLGAREEVTLFGRAVSGDMTRRALLLVGVGIIWCFGGTMVLSIFEGPAHNLRDLMFEQVSAFGTVGLSLNLTPHLGTPARLWLILTMFVGRLGPLSVALWAIPRNRGNVSYPEGRIMIG